MVGNEILAAVRALSSEQVRIDPPLDGGIRTPSGSFLMGSIHQDGGLFTQTPTFLRAQIFELGNAEARNTRSAQMKIYVRTAASQSSAPPCKCNKKLRY